MTQTVHQMEQNALSRGRRVQSVSSDLLSPTDNRAKVKLLLARKAALTSGQLFEKLTLTMQRNYLTLSENMLATVERCAKVTW